MKTKENFSYCLNSIIQKGYTVNQVMGWKDNEFTVVAYSATSKTHWVTNPTIEGLLKCVKNR